MEKIPLVSVIIPMYNAAKFIPQTLESLLYQTMKDFEVVVIDDCSTDNSIEVVESFEPRFDSGGGYQKLHIIKLPKNTGTPGLPRNVGIQFARGKYIAFLDSDDLYTKTALEELSTLAEKSQAEIVHMEDYFMLWGGRGKSVDDPLFTDMNELTNPANFYKARNSKFHPDKPHFETDNLAERVKNFIAGGYAGEPYANFYRRDFLITNQIFFRDICIYEDQIFAFQAMCLAEKILRVPNINYIFRPRANSVTREQIQVDAEIHKSLRIDIDGFNALIKIMNEINFFAEHPDYRYAVLDWYVNNKLYRLQGFYAQIHPAALNPLVEKEFHADDTAFAAYLFNTVNIYRLQIMQLQQENIQLKKILEQK